ncbi:hypothetical protein ABW20_dc0103159 [Dactylellina cionopaga]|nr:hypothetical protein ABW20_dc0103159 [Dactylellina cionopaga]
MAHSELFLELPTTIDLGVSPEQDEEYERLLFSYIEHKDEADADAYFQPVKKFLEQLQSPPDIVTEFLERFCKSSEEEASSVSKIELSSEPSTPLEELEEEKKEESRQADGEQAGGGQADGGQPFGGQPVGETDGEADDEAENTEEEINGKYEEDEEDNEEYEAEEELPAYTDKLRLYSALNYNPEYTDFKLDVGTGEMRTVFKVHTEYLFKHIPSFEERLETHQFPHPKNRFSRDIDQDPVAFDYCLAWIYGEPFEIPQSRNKVGSIIDMVVGCLNFALHFGLHDLAAEIAEKMGISFRSRYWSYTMAPVIAHLYEYHAVFVKKPIRITPKQLAGFVYRLNRQGHIHHLKRFLKSIAEVEVKPGHSEFYRDMSVALCIGLTQKKSEPAPSVGSIIVVEKIELPLADPE